MHLTPIQIAPFAGQPKTPLEPPVSLGGGFEAVLQMLTPREPLVAGPKVVAVADGPGEGESLEGEGLADVGSTDQPTVQLNGVGMLVGVQIAEAPPIDRAAGRAATGSVRGWMVDGRDDDPASPAELGSAPQPLPVAAAVQIAFAEESRGVPAESFATKTGESPAFHLSEGDVPPAGVTAATGPANVDANVEPSAVLTLPPAAASAPSSQDSRNATADAPKAVLIEKPNPASHVQASLNAAPKGEAAQAETVTMSGGISHAQKSADSQGKPTGAAKAMAGGVTRVQTAALEGRSGNTGTVAPPPLIGSTEAGADVQTLRSMADRGQLLRSVESDAEAENFARPTRSAEATASNAAQAEAPHLFKAQFPESAPRTATVWNTVTTAEPGSEKAVVVAPLTLESALAGQPPFVVAPDASVAAPLTQGAARPISVPATMAQIADVIVAQRDGTTEISLNPHELGRVKVTISGDSSDLQVGLIVERPETLELVRCHADLLVRELRDNGVAQSRIDFTAQDDASRGGPAQGCADRGGHGSAQRDPSRAGSGLDDALHVDTANDSGLPIRHAPGAARGGQAGSGRLDIRI